VSAHMQTINRC